MVEYILHRTGCGAGCSQVVSITVVYRLAAVTQATVANPHCREYWPPTEDGGGAASAERKADRPVQLEPNRPAQPASPRVQPRPGA